jgi:hypothetical protein
MTDTYTRRRQKLIGLAEKECSVIGQPHDEQVIVMCNPTHDILTHPRNRRWVLQEGRVTVSQLICLVLLCVAGLQGLKFVASWNNILRLKGAMQEAVNQVQVLTDDDMISAVLAKAQELKVPLDPRHLHVERSTYGGTRLWATYDVTVALPLGFSQTYTFHPEVQSAHR